MTWHTRRTSWLAASLAVAILWSAAPAEPPISFEERNEIRRLILSLASSDEAVSQASSLALEGKGEKAVPCLVSALTVNPNPRIRYQAARVLGEIRDERGVDPLFQASVLDPDGSVRRIAKVSLDSLTDLLSASELEDRRVRIDYQRFDRRSIFSLRRRVKSDPDASVRPRAARALANHGDERDLSTLLDVARGDKVAAVRREVAAAIVEIAHTIIQSEEYRVTFFGTLTRGPDTFREEMIGSLIDLVENDPDPSVRLVLVRGLTRISFPTFVMGEESFGPFLTLKARAREVIVRVRDCFVSLLRNDASAEVRREAALSLSKLFTAFLDIGNQEVNDELRRSFLRQRKTYALTYPGVPGGATYFYHRSFNYLPPRTKRIVKPVQDALARACASDPDASVRREAVLGLTYLGEKKHARAILDRLRVEKNEGVWLASMEALSRLGGGAAAEALLDVFRKLSNGERVRKAAVLSIGRIGTKKVLRNLAVFVPKEPTREVKIAILEALGLQRDEQTAAVLAKACQDRDPEVRIAAVSAMGNNFTDGTLALLKRILKEDPDENVRAAACTSLSKTLKRKAAPLLTEALKDKGSAVRERAAAELGLQGIKESVDALVSVLAKDSNPFVRGEAATALGSIGGYKSVRPLINAVADDSSPVVRQDALRALLKTDEPRSAMVAIVAMLPNLAGENPYAYIELNDALIQLRDKVYGRDFMEGSRVGMPGIMRTRGIRP